MAYSDYSDAPLAIPTPEQLITEAKTVAKAEVDNACRRIVLEMRKAAAVGRASDISVSLKPGEDVRVALIRERFTAMGWIVDTGADQREGAWIRLKAPRSQGGA